MRVLHTESSSGWGGQEMRILKEAEGLRSRGHHIVIAVAAGGSLAGHARDRGFTVYEVPMERRFALHTLIQLIRIIKDHEIDIVNTHSSWDAWIAAIAARLLRKKVIRTRHLSTKIKGGLNSFLLYRTLADYVVTTSSCIIPFLVRSARINERCVRCIATGVDPSALDATEAKDVAAVRQQHAAAGQLLIGTACFVRSWKGVLDLMEAAKLLKASHPHIRWVVIGGGYYKDYEAKLPAMGIDDVFTFTGHLDSPFAAIAALDVFALVSTASEGISQASLQAAYLSRPLITTDIGGLPEVCIDSVTGIVVPIKYPRAIADAVVKLSGDPHLRQRMGQKAKELVLARYTLNHTLDGMEEVYQAVCDEEALVGDDVCPAP
jgi:glycosyltransferase involved in cell wall biosynthesis